MVDSRSSESFLVPPSVRGAGAATAGSDCLPAFTPRQSLSVLVLPARNAAAAAVRGDIIDVAAAAAPRGVGRVSDGVVAAPSSGRRFEPALSRCVRYT